MQRFTQVVLSALAIVASIPVSMGDESLDLTHQGIMEKLVAYRREHFNVGYVRLNVVYPGSGDKKPETEYRFDIWFDGDSIRKDQTLLRLRDRKPQPGERWFTTRIVWANDKFIEQHKIDPNLAVTISPQEKPDGWRKEGLFHPRALGTSTSGISSLGRYPLEYRLSPSEENGMKPASAPIIEHIDGQDLYRVEYLYPSGSAVTHWINPNQGYGIVRSQVVSERDGSRRVSTIDVQLAKYGEEGYWYPKHCNSLTTRDEHEIDGQTITVEEAEFGVKSNPRVFKLAGMDLPKGQSLNDYSRPDYDGHLIWDGEFIVHVIGDRMFRLKE